MLALNLIALLLIVVTAYGLTDNHESCEFWAGEGECDQNPTYMLENCAKSCAEVAESGSDSELGSFYDISGETDILGRKLSNFSIF